MPAEILAFGYAVTVTAGGILGYAKSHSAPSLGAGLLLGSLLGYGAFQMSVDPTNISVFLGASTTVGGIMGYRFCTTGKVKPAGIITILSAVMIVRTIRKYSTAVAMKTQ